MTQRNGSFHLSCHKLCVFLSEEPTTSRVRSLLHVVHYFLLQFGRGKLRYLHRLGDNMEEWAECMDVRVLLQPSLPVESMLLANIGAQPGCIGLTTGSTPTIFRFRNMRACHTCTQSPLARGAGDCTYSAQ